MSSSLCTQDCSLLLMVIYCFSMRKFCSSESRQNLMGFMCDLTVFVCSYPLCFCLAFIDYGVSAMLVRNMLCISAVCEPVCLNVWECLTTKTNGKTWHALLCWSYFMNIMHQNVLCTQSRGVFHVTLLKDKKASSEGLSTAEGFV